MTPAEQPRAEGRFTKRLTTMQAVLLMTDLANGMTQVAAAEKYGISRSTVNRIKHDKYKPKRQPASCGTNAGYARHNRRGEKCWKCSAAHAAQQKEWSDGKDRTRGETGEGYAR